MICQMQFVIVTFCFTYVLFYSGTDIANTIEKKLNDEKNVVDSWLRDNSLFLHAAKTESMLFGTCAKLKNANCFNIHVSGCIINRVLNLL